MTTVAPLDNKVTLDWSATLSQMISADGMSLFHTRAKSYADILVLTRAFLDGQLTTSFNAIGGLYSETVDILDLLQVLNTAGVWTVSSQPGKETKDNRQRMYIEGYMERAWFESTVQPWLEKSNTENLLYHVVAVHPATVSIHEPLTVLASNVPVTDQDPATSFPVTQSLLPKASDVSDLQDNFGSWTSTTAVYFGQELQETRQYVHERYEQPQNLLQCVFVAREFGPNASAMELYNVFSGIKYPMLSC
ncbi:hypothetical protein DFS34DRAFT_653328 [Phlyctochytrium arcticum]|nr:hypothetical protein DFS34DRAFT_653328 [Phlyctochytrium arcticum]